MLFTGLKFLERCGKTGFFRSGLEPLILDESQRLQRRKKRIEEFSKNRDLSGRGIFLVPHLAHSGNFAPPQDDATSESLRLFHGLKNESSKSCLKFRDSFIRVRGHSNNARHFSNPL
jgi:hypothetical protein